MIRSPAILSIAALLCLCQTATAAPGLSVDVYPTIAGVQSTGYVASATSFQVDIVIAGVEAVAPLNGFEFDLSFDPGILVATNIVDGGILLAPVLIGQQTVGIMTVEFAEITLLPAGASGDGVLATITFDVIGLGVTALDLDAVVLSAPFGVEILATALNDGSIHSVPEPSASLAIGVGALIILRRIRKRPGQRVRRARNSALTLIAGSLALAPIASAQISPAMADLTGDGTVNILDLSTMGSRFGVIAGQHGYRGGLDLVPDSVIDTQDINGLLPYFGQSGVETEGTTFRGRVFDSLGNPFEGVAVQLGASAFETCTDLAGTYAMMVGSADVGDVLVTFDGAGGRTCAGVDPTPDFLSGQYPTIPNKPVFINAGTENVFRSLPLPERDLTGSQLVDASNSASLGANAFMFSQLIEVQNAGVTLEIPAGCTATFPVNEDPVLSITRVPPAMTPVPMPPGLSSTLFVTYQPGGTEIQCPPGSSLVARFDNADQLPLGLGDLQTGPFLAGITNGVFTPLVACDVTADAVDCGPIPLPFDFAWYFVAARRDICPRTNLVGRVLDVRVGKPPEPVSFAKVSVPGVVPVTTAADGSFSIPNVPAGPNGPGCFANAFSVRASAAADLNGSGSLEPSELGVSLAASAVPGGITSLGDIPVGQPGGTVQGRALELQSIRPFVVAPLADELVELFPAAGRTQLSVTDAAGNYGFPTVPRGAYTAQNGSDQRSGAIDFAGDVDVQSFLFTRTGAVSVVMTTEAGVPVNDFFATLTAFGGDLGAGFVAPSADCTASTAPGDNVVVFSEDSCVSSEDPNLNGVPQGACEVNVYLEGQTAPIATYGPEKGCFVNRAGEVVVIACGIGFELALVVPFLMFARRRRAQTRRNRSTGLSDNAACIQSYSQFQ